MLFWSAAGKCMNDWIQQHPIPFVALVFAGIIVFRALLLNAIAMASGWRMLAQHFSVQQPYSGQQWKWQSAMMRYFVGYNNCLCVGADQAGLFVRTMWGARTGHPPLFVPWNEVSMGQATEWLGNKFVALSLGRTEQVPFRIRASLAAKIQVVAGPSWPTPTDAQIPVYKA
jgi:hypothetical protein